MTYRVLELFSGLGGWRYALEGLGEVVAAYDISPLANETYALNHGTRPLARELASLPSEAILSHGADLWAMSPPCQPFCRMGHGRGLEDARSRAYLHLLEILPKARPRALLLENVTGFLGSEAHARLLEVFRILGFHWRDLQMCPTRLGIPNQRPRAYVVGSCLPLREPLQAEVRDGGPLAPFLDPEEDPAFRLPEEVLERHRHGMDFVRPDSRRSTCFIGGYGQRYVGSGSFLETPGGVRRFSPSEIARLLGLPASFRFPESVPLEPRYKLLGNSLSIPAARWAAQHLDPGLS